MKKKVLLFPSDFFDKRKVDNDLKNEYNAALETGLYEVILFDYEEWYQGGKLSLSYIPSKKISAIYRGWMMQEEQYTIFYNILNANNIELITTPEEYKHFHVFPNIYKDICDDTPQIAVVPNGKNYVLDDIKNKFERFLVKDFVKSAKGTDFPKYFTREISEEDFDEWMQKFYKYRGNLFTGGLCFKEYVDLAIYGTKTNEYRVFYVNNKPITISRNSGQGNYTPMPPMDFINKYSGLASKYYTLDFAELDDHSWKILEAGDGGVSGLSEGQDMVVYYRALYYAIN